MLFDYCEIRKGYCKSRMVYGVSYENGGRKKKEQAGSVLNDKDM